MKKILAFAIGVLALASCAREVAPVKVDSSREVKFTTNINTFTVKAGETALEGKTVQVLAGSPLNTGSAATVTGNSLELTNKIYWQDGQEAKTTFVSIYPGNNQTSTTVEYDITEDYEYHANYMTATAKDVEPETTVALNYKHPFAKVVVTVTNNLTAGEVTSVALDGVVLSAKLDLAAEEIELGADKVAANAALQEDGTYAAIIMPQTVKPALIVNAGEKSYKFVLAAEVEFQANKSYAAAVTIEDGTTPIEEGGEVGFDVTVSDWEEADPLAYEPETPEVNPNEGKWSVIGLGGDWETDVWMTETSEGIWEADITYAEGDSFKLRQDGKWSSETETHAEAGMPNTAEGYVPADGSEYGLWGADNKDIVLAAAGEYHIKFIPDGYKFYVTTDAEPVTEPLDISELYLLGAATDTGWALDAMAQFTKEGDVFTLTANLKPNEKFRFPLQKESNVWWPCVVAGETEGSVQIGDGDSYDDYQFTVTEDGSYTIVVDAAAATVTITRVGDRVEPDPELYILGDATDTGWSLDDMAALTYNATNGTFTITTHLSSDGQFRFPLQKVSGTWWPCLVKGATDGTLVQGNADEDNNPFTVSTDGTYTITIDIDAMTISIVLVEADPDDPAPAGDVWTIIGSLGGDTWTTDIAMTETSDGVWEADITYAEGEEFKLRANGDWDVNAGVGTAAPATDGTECILAQGGNNITLPAAGNYHIKFIPDGYKVYITVAS